MMDTNTLVDNILLRHAAIEDNDSFRRFVAVIKAIDTIVPLLISTVLLAAVFMLAACI